MQTFTDSNSPRQRLRFEELPRGFIKFPDHVVEGLKKEQARLGCCFTDQYARRSLERHTLVWYYDGLPVAYRSLSNGIEVLALGWEETAKYLLTPEEGVKVVQP
jgi:hypothetical protein